MRKLVISIFLVSVLMGAALPAMANPQTISDTITQTQTAIPISVANTNTALFGSAGNQNVFQSQSVSVCKVNYKVASDDGVVIAPGSGNNNRICKDP